MERATTPSDPNFFYYAHELTWEELCQVATKRRPAVATLCDSIVSSVDVRFDPASKEGWNLWLGDVHTAYSNCRPGMRPEVIAQYLANVDQLAPPGRKEEKVLQLVTPEKGNVAFRPPKFTWSLTAIQDFESCAKYFARKKFFKDLPSEEDSYHLIEGREGHGEAEKCLRKRVLSTSKSCLKSLDGRPLGETLNPFINVFLKASEGHETLVEFQMCITEQMQPTGYKDWTNGWGRGGVDFAIIKPDRNGILTAYIYDWKLGKKKDEDLQLLLYCAFLSLHRPEIQQFVAKYVWLKETDLKNAISGINPSKPQVITKEMIPVIWASVLKRVKRMQEAWNAQVFNASPSPLCSWRSCSKSCEYKR